jgi:hypothetical protein
MLLLAACGTSPTVDLESLGLLIDADIQAGSQFSVAVPAQPDTTIEVVSAPPGVIAAITGPDSTDTYNTYWLTIEVDADTPRGAYALALRVVQGGKESQLGWPFDVTDMTTTTPGTEAVLIVDIPQVGDVFPSPSAVQGQASSSPVGYRLTGGDDLVLAEGTFDVLDGAFSGEIEFTNTCCIEIRLEVFETVDGGLSVSVPLTYPESG